MRSEQALILFFAMVSAGCAAASMETDDSGPGNTKATASLTPTAGYAATGSMTFTSLGGQVRLNVGISNLTPSSVHAFHLHVGPNCGTDGMQAGARWNPAVSVQGAAGSTGSGGTGNMGAPAAAGGPAAAGAGGSASAQRLGDIGNITVDMWGQGAVEILTDAWTIGTGSVDDVVGRAAILYAEPDPSTAMSGDNTSARIACGTIQLSR